MSAVLAEHRTAVVRQLSTGTLTSELPGMPVAERPEPQLEQGVAGVRAALGRQLKSHEARFLHLLKELYNRSRRTHQLSYSDIQGLGYYRLNGFGWIYPKIWPAFPESEYEFWQYLANFLTQQGAQIPEFIVRSPICRWSRNGLPGGNVPPK